MHEKKREPPGPMTAIGKLATLSHSYLIKVSSMRKFLRVWANQGSPPDTYSLLRVTCHFAKGTEQTGMMPSRILTVGHSCYDCLGSETSDLVSVTQCSQCKVGITNNTYLTRLW